jgi:uncharacterized protein YjbI with pentapeptide repeats
LNLNFNLFLDTDFISPTSGNDDMIIYTYDDVTLNFTNCGFYGMYLSSEYTLYHPLVCYTNPYYPSESYYSNCTFSNMTHSQSSDYGGVIGLSMDYSPSYARLVNCNFENLELGSATTGAVYFAYSYFSYINVSQCVFTNVHAGNGGGLYFYSHSTSSPQIVINCSFINCTVNNFGGAIYLESQPINITNCSFSYNNASGGRGNDIYLAVSISFPSSNLEGSCSSSSAPTLSVSSSDQSSLLGVCGLQNEGYLASSSNNPPGSDSGGMYIFFYLMYYKNAPKQVHV